MGIEFEREIIKNLICFEKSDEWRGSQRILSCIKSRMAQSMDKLTLTKSGEK